MEHATEKRDGDGGSGRVTLHGIPVEELQGSLVFYRRQLAARLLNTMVNNLLPHDTNDTDAPNLSALAEDFANALCERLAARETGQPGGYADVPKPY